VQIAGEEALVIWDPRARREHFIRTADFDPTDDDFGFLVPTPTRPELAAAPDRIFNELFDVYRARDPIATPQAPPGARSAPGAATAPSVMVLERRTVAGLDAAVLAASDAGALDRWLAERGYPSGPELARWLEPYVARGWIVTAFRISPGAERRRFATSAVRMSFETTRPFFPYSEPQHAGPRGRGRPFRVSVVAPYRVRALEGERPWGARVGYAGRPGGLGPIVGRPLATSVTPSSWLTVFDEPRSVRGASDVYFERDESAREVSSTIRTQILSAGGG
jgi:hypothetical protein